MNTRLSKRSFVHTVAFVLAASAAAALTPGCATTGGGASSGGGGGGATLFGKPKGAPWTILAYETRGPYAVRNAETLADLLRKFTDLNPKNVRVTHDQDGFSRIYYGTYYRQRDPQTGEAPVPPELQRDLRLIRLLQSEDAKRHFIMARKMPVPQPDVGRPEWALQTVKKPYTLQVAVFESFEIPEFKQAAADYCAELRRKGYEAYYHHGLDTSVVTVGAFDRDAVRVEGGIATYSKEVTDLQAKETFAYNLTNGRKLTVRQQGVESPVASQLMLVPGFEPIQMEEYRPGQ